MAKRDKLNTSKKPRRHHESDGHRFRPVEDGREHRVHLDITAGRRVGSALLTAEACSLMRWRKRSGVSATAATHIGIGDSNVSDAAPDGVTQKDLSGQTA